MKAKDGRYPSSEAQDGRDGRNDSRGVVCISLLWFSYVRRSSMGDLGPKWRETQGLATGAVEVYLQTAESEFSSK